MRVWLHVPYDEKDWAKALGARFNWGNKQWYVDDPEDLVQFSSWIDPRLLDFYDKKKPGVPVEQLHAAEAKYAKQQEFRLKAKKAKGRKAKPPARSSC